MRRKNCACTACVNLQNECGDERFEMYAKKLLIYGWSGSTSATEDAYRKVHGPVVPATPPKPRLLAAR